MGQHEFFLLIKPYSYRCNLRCDYCFYLCKEELYGEEPDLRMSDAVLERTLQTYLATKQPQYNICWQGGEPTLMGLDFFRRAVEFQKKHGRRGSLIANALQTNATLLDDSWGEFLNEYRFLVGVSIDGTSRMHDRYRRTAGGEGTWRRVSEGIALLKRHQVECNLLALVNSYNVQRPQKLYSFLKGLDIPYLQFTPCVEFDSGGNLLPYAITGEQWGSFLNAVFDEWVRSDRGRISIRGFDAVLEHLVYGSCTMCTMGQSCSQYFVVEHNGDIYPCDFFVENRYRLGNIMEDSWEELLLRKEYINFGKRKQIQHPECGQCPYVQLCNGDCPKNRFYAGENPKNRSFLCEGWKQFFTHALPVLGAEAYRLSASGADIVYKR